MFEIAKAEQLVAKQLSAQINVTKKDFPEPDGSSLLSGISQYIIPYKIVFLNT